MEKEQTTTELSEEEARRERIKERMGTNNNKNVVSLGLAAVGLLMSITGGMFTSNNWKTTWAYFLGTLIVWLLNYTVADKLVDLFSDLSESHEKSKGLVFNKTCVLLMGILSAVICFNISNETLDVLIGIVTLIIFPCFLVGQIIAAVKVMKNGGGLLAFIVILYLLFAVVAAVVMADLTYGKGTETIFYAMGGCEFIITMAMYALYNKYFKTFQTEETNEED